MKIQFDSNQQYQLDAIQVMVEIFDGQPLARGEYEIRFDAAGGDLLTQLGVGNNLVLDESTILGNLRGVQERNEIKPVSTELDGMNFSVEMETGTGKTYVYLRSIYELNKIYGFKKFVIVVPSVAIREGVLKNIELTREHFQAIYGNVPIDSWVYDSKQVSRLRSYANSNQLQILIINIDAFNKPANNVIHQENDKLSGRKPIDFLQATNPIVVVDEPQNMESEQAKAAIERLNPLCTLRYSATHRNLYNQVYRLDPVAAYDLKLVKRIEVDAILDDPDFNKPYIEVKSVKATKTKITAKLAIDVNTPNGPKGVLGDGVGQADQQQAVGDRVGRLAGHVLLVDLGRQRQPGLEHQLVEDVLLATVRHDVVGEELQLTGQGIGILWCFIAVPNLEIAGREF